MDIREIQQLLPHRYPFLLVDRVEIFEPGKRLVAFKNVTFNEPFFGGHFPNHPVMPGVLILEALAQACAILTYKTTELSPEENVSYLMAVDQAKFRRPVVPGDKLLLSVNVLRQKGVVWKHKGEATVDGQVVAEAEFMATLRRREAGET
ncbi:MAG: 3-hydroxyacyl-ACP dehydratase FabZ [Proteobacteria bacterium]|nr:3-hydroxyacyl-ACP dehydratase FabZ [Cystobacterineae bacterium]MCL2259522.1 3-hydroxyacyl-ACP dehydratase FabZ [Cystobacterineae bacterium]MCL2314001.1 3-hydroxyacyl-ACP dehydratase FabZ [Pseudomonadota bacterium]